MSDDDVFVQELLRIPGASARRRGDIVVALRIYRGRESLDIRWFASRDAGATFHATKRGACIPVHHLPEFLEAVREAVEITKPSAEPTS